MTAVEKQIGGSHYKELKYEPIVLIAKIKMNFFEGNVLKYLSRNKNGREDLQKALHYLELAKELNVSYGNREYDLGGITDYDKSELTKYCDTNGFDEYVYDIMWFTLTKTYNSAIDLLTNIIDEL